MLIANNETQAEILVGMKALCSVLPTAYQPAVSFFKIVI